MTFATRTVPLLVLLCAASPLTAQEVGVRGVLTYGTLRFAAHDSFEAALGKSSAPIYTGGGQLLLPYGVYIEFTTGKLEQDGQRVVLTAGQAVPHAQPLEITLRPIEITGGWRYRRSDRFVPYGGGGYSRYRYQALSEFAAAGENIDQSFSGFHILGGGEYLPVRWLALGGEVAWSSVPDAPPIGRVSEALGETNLGGTTLRLKVSIGR